MAKTIRRTYPLEFSIGLLLLIFLFSSFLSSEIFPVTYRDLMGGDHSIYGMFLAGVAVVLMALIQWEEFLFPLRLKLQEDVVVFRNHSTKLVTQGLIYCIIPIIVAFVYFNYEVNLFPFTVWAAICLIMPIVGKLSSGIRNYNDFLKLTNDVIEYKNNEKEGVLNVSEIRQINLITDESHVPHKIQVTMTDNREATIDLDEMELEAYCQTIDKFIRSHYKGLVKESSQR